MTGREVKQRVACLGIGMALAVSRSHAGEVLVVDQSNSGPPQTSNGSGNPFSFGQSFTPALDAIDAIDFYVGGTRSTMYVVLRGSVAGGDGLGGTSIAESGRVLVDRASDGFTRFRFSERIALVPGNTYVAEIVAPSGDIGVAHTQGDVYGGGQFLHRGWLPEVFQSADLVFREGLLEPVPEPATMALAALGLVFTGFAIRYRKRNAVA